MIDIILMKQLKKLFGEYLSDSYTYAAAQIICSEFKKSEMYIRIPITKLCDYPHIIKKMLETSESNTLCISRDEGILEHTPFVFRLYDELIGAFEVPIEEMTYKQEDFECNAMAIANTITNDFNKSLYSKTQVKVKDLLPNVSDDWLQEMQKLYGLPFIITIEKDIGIANIDNGYSKKNNKQPNISSDIPPMF